MDIISLGYFALSSLFIAILPGPAMMLVIQGSMEQGWQKGIQISLGILLGDLVLLIAIMTGIGEIFAKSEQLLFLMNIATACYLIYLGGQSLYQIHYIQTQENKQTKRTNWQSGFWITVINPKTIIFLLAYFPQFIQTNSEITIRLQLGILSALFVICVAIVMFFYAFCANWAKQYLNKPISQKIMALIFGLLLIYIGMNSLF